jgi:hypothetical protein
MRATVAVLAVPVLVATAFSPPPPQCAPRARSRLAMQMQTGVGAEGGARRATSRRHVLGRGAAAMGSVAAAAVLGVPRVSGAFDVEGFAEQVRKREDLIQKLDREKALPGGHSERVQAWLRRQSGLLLPGLPTCRPCALQGTCGPFLRRLTVGAALCGQSERPGEATRRLAPARKSAVPSVSDGRHSHIPV